MTVHQLMATMSAEEFDSWVAFSQLEPFGDIRADLQAGQVAAAVYNVHRKKGNDPINPMQFLMFRPESAREAERIRKMRAVASRMAPPRRVNGD